MGDNPYASPGESGPGGYDWTTAKRMLLAFALLACFYLLCSAVGAWRAFRADCNHRHEPAINTLVEFALNWRDGDGER